MERGTNAVICLEVVNVLAEDEGPEVFAEKFDNVESIVKARTVS